TVSHPNGRSKMPDTVQRTFRYLNFTTPAALLHILFTRRRYTEDMQLTIPLQIIQQIWWLRECETFDFADVTNDEISRICAIYYALLQLPNAKRRTQ
ncbi:MAG: hypothetical protein KDE47_09655, partial [Caldilineaceae bacterium]|nr:hypothetical protein [Caldilineaceae bacterium]